MVEFEGSKETSYINDDLPDSTDCHQSKPSKYQKPTYFRSIFAGSRAPIDGQLPLSQAEEAALRRVAELAVEEKTGARALVTILEKVGRWDVSESPWDVMGIATRVAEWG